MLVGLNMVCESDQLIAGLSIDKGAFSISSGRTRPAVGLSDLMLRMFS
jgi:hypothetical protein